MTDFEKQLYDLSLIPVIRIETADWAEPLAHALCGGGLPAAEVTFRTPCAAEAIRRMKEAEPDMLVGAGTVLTPAQADEAAAAGASFIVSPGLNRSVVEHCLSLGIPVVPGCATPSDVECAIGLGLTTVKFFPAEPSGGLKMLRAMSGPYGGIRFMPTGGITPANLSSYLSCPAVLACGGSFMIDEEAMRRGDFTDEDMRFALLSLQNTFRSVEDGLFTIESYYRAQKIFGIEETPEDQCRKLAAVTKEQIVAAARMLHLDTIYLLNGTGEGGPEEEAEYDG